MSPYDISLALSLKPISNKIKKVIFSFKYPYKFNGDFSLYMNGGNKYPQSGGVN